MTATAIRSLKKLRAYLIEHWDIAEHWANHPIHEGVRCLVLYYMGEVNGILPRDANGFTTDLLTIVEGGKKEEMLAYLDSMILAHTEAA